jgi:hypothetical protein
MNCFSVNRCETPARHEPLGGCGNLLQFGGWKPPQRSAARLAICSAFLAVVWLLVLPAIGSRPGLRRKIQMLDARGIDASALFYTDLEMMRGEIVGRKWALGHEGQQPRCLGTAMPPFSNNWAILRPVVERGKSLRSVRRTHLTGRERVECGRPAT